MPWRSRLSYFLWSSLPDDELLAAGQQGRIDQARRAARPGRADAEVDPKAHRFTENFAGQWLDLRKINATSPTRSSMASSTDFLFWSMPRETQLFFEEVLQQRPAACWTSSTPTGRCSTSAWRSTTAFPDVDGNELRKVKLPAGSHRGGVMTQASILKVTADGTRTSPVLRGKWVLERIIGKPPAPPPPDVPAIEPDIRGATTIRQQLDKHRNIAACASCHIHIDPPGFALENFDVIGGWRDFYRASTRTKQGHGRTGQLSRPARSIAAPMSKRAARRPTAGSSRTSTSTRNSCWPTRTSWPAI